MSYLQKTYYTNTKSQMGVDGIHYDSKLEANYGNELFLRKKAGDIIDYEAHVPLELAVNDVVVCTYKVDFVVYHDGLTEYIEIKGFWTPVAKLKFKLFLALYDKPGNKITVMKQGKQWKPQMRRKKV